MNHSQLKQSISARMAQLRMEKINAAYASYECDHQATEMRRRVVKGGAIQYVQQCLRCGSPTTGAIAKTKALSMNGGAPVTDFDDALNESWKENKQAAISGIYQEERGLNFAWWEWHTQYLKSPEWAANRRKVIQRSQGLCEGCREAEPVEVHHLSYDHVGDELLFELVALCKACHDKAHGHNDDDSDFEPF